MNNKPCICGRDDRYCVRILCATRRNNEEEVQKCIDLGVNVNEKDYTTTNSLIWASSHGYVEIVKLLLEAKANVCIRDVCGETALVKAKMNGHLEVVELLKDL